MRTTVTLDDESLETAMKFTEIKERATVIRVALERLVQREAAPSLAAMGGTNPTATAGRRRRRTT